MQTNNEVATLANGTNVWELIVGELRACGPVSERHLAAYLLEQAQGVTRDNCRAVAEVAVALMLHRGVIEVVEVVDGQRFLDMKAAG